MAYARRPLDVSAAKGLVAGVKGLMELDSLAVGRLRATSMVKGFADAIVCLLVAKLLEGVEISIELGGDVEDGMIIRSLDWLDPRSFKSNHNECFLTLKLSKQVRDLLID